MKYIGFLKRFVPFLVALGLGLFVASFFVTLSAPKVEIRTSVKKIKHNRLHAENRRLKRENCRLKKEAKSKERRIVRVTKPLLAPPPPPPPPRLVVIERK